MIIIYTALIICISALLGLYLWTNFNNPYVDEMYHRDQLYELETNYFYAEIQHIRRT